MRQVFRFVGRLLHEQPVRFTVSVLLLTIAGLLEGVAVAALVPLLEQMGGGASQAGMVGDLTRALIAYTGMPVNLLSILIFVSTLIVGTQLVLLAQQRVVSGSIYKFEASLRSSLFEDVFSAGWPFFAKEKASDLVNAIMAEAQRATIAYINVNLMLSMVVIVIAYGILATVISWQMTLLILVVGGTMSFLLKNRVSRGARFGASLTELNQAVQSEAFESITGAKLVKGCAAEAESARRFHGLVGQLAHTQYRQQMNGTLVKVLYDSVSVVAVLAGVYFASTILHMPISLLVVFLLAFYRISPRVSNIQLYQHNVLAYAPALDRIDELRATARSMAESSGDLRLEAGSHGIRFEDVEFGYDTDAVVLNGLDLSIEAGSMTAVVGPSGAGKTTVVDLVMRLILPNRGSVAVDGVPMQDLDVKDWRRRIGYVAQDAVLFHASIAENIRFGAPWVTDAQVREAARLAYADEFIMQFADGYDTIVGDRGLRLSGGQRQRIALARAIVREPEILILDEATSALDAESEERIQAAVAHLAQQLTVLVVTHRLSTVRDADAIYVMEGGRVVEHGTFDELVARGGRFDELRRMQALDVATQEGDG